MKPQALIFFGLFERLKSIWATLIERSDYIIVSDRKFDDTELPPDRFHLRDDVVDLLQLKQRAEEEASLRSGPMVSYLLDNVKELPYSSQFDDESREVIAMRIRHGLREFYRNFFTFEELLKHYDIRCSVLSPAYLDKYQSVNALSQANNIPTIHLQHGSWISPEFHHPETANIVAFADNFAFEIQRQHHVSDALRVVTGLPFNTISDPKVLDSEYDKKRKQNARRALGINPNAGVILYTCTFMEGLYVSMTCQAYKTVELMEQVITVAREREEQGKETVVIIRQNPLRAINEHTQAVYSIAEDLGYRKLQVINDQKELVIDACDMIIPGASDSSVLLDAFAAGRPAVGLHTIPRSAHVAGSTLVSQYCTFVHDIEQLRGAVNKLLDDKSYWTRRQKEGYEFVTSMRPYTAEAGKENVCSLIIDTASHGVDYVREQRAL